MPTPPATAVGLLLALLHFAETPQSLANNAGAPDDIGFSSIAGDDAPRKTWPPIWLEGLWENTDTAITVEGKPSNRNFLCGSHYLFLSGFRFSVYKGSRIRATPMMGHTRQGNVLHCLFKMTNERAAMRAEFSGNAETSEYVSYLISSSDGKRYKFKRTLARVTDEEQAIKIIKSTFDREFISTHSPNAEAILERWIEHREQVITESKRQN